MVRSMKKILYIILIIIYFVISFILLSNSKINVMKDLTNYNIEEIEEYSKNNNLDLQIQYEYSDSIEKDKLISQSIKEGSKINKNDILSITISKGSIDYNKLGVNELGRVPIMMYHGIYETKNNDSYIGGNVDKDGYGRTIEAFKSDLEMYYEKGYRMIRLDDYINGIIDVEAGLSPIIITFDDGLENNIRVTGLDNHGNIIIDPNSAIGILEQFKQKYPDYNVTATFFVNGSLFNQPEYNEKILKWLINNGYDIGNHTYNHVDFTKVDSEKSVQEVGKLYKVFHDIIPNKYVNIVALPFGSPYKMEHYNFKNILNGEYDGFAYETSSTLRVGWEAEVSPYSKNFNTKFLKRIRAYDNNGAEFDIEMNFKILDTNRYISDGDKSIITIPSNINEKIKNNYNLKINNYNV